MRGRRMFIAVDPPTEVAARARAIVDRLRAAGVEAAWVPPAQLHLTLHFLGDEVDDADLHRICVAMDEAAATMPAHRLGFGGVGVFPDVRRPRVVWLGVREGTADLTRLYNALAERLEPLGFPPEARGFRPHLTLGRFRDRGQAGGAALADAIASGDDAVTAAMQVRRIVLYESRLSKAGAEHDRLHAAALANG
ncbi:MAG: RNA 2',3'-cyclic phosphodiesterase [Planctomycetaceae bacterium]